MKPLSKAFSKTRLKPMTTVHLSTQKTPEPLTLKDKVAKLPLAFKMLLALLAGAVFPFALAPYGIIPLAIISPAVLYALLWQSSTRHAFFLGEAYGIGLWCVGAFWLYTSIHVYGDTHMVLALGMILFVGVGMGLFHGLLALCFRRFFSFMPLSFAALWVLQEWIKTWLFTGFPWLFVGYAYTETFVDAYAPMLGIYAISFVGVCVAACLVEVASKRWFWLLPATVLLVVAAATQHIQWTQKAPKKPLTVTLIQGNIPQDMKWLTSYRFKTLQIYYELSLPFWGKSDVVVWPESAIPMFQTEAWPFMAEIVRIAKKHNTSWVTGVPYADEAKYDKRIHDYAPFYNSIIALGADAKGIYHKQRLVPFGEYIPFEGKLKWVLPNLARNQDIMSFSEGKQGQKPLNVKGAKLSSAICYEVAYPDITRRNAVNSNFMITLSNDAWFGTSAGPLQHLQMVQMRAREVGRWFIRATNTGATAFIDERGRMVAMSERFKRNTLTHQLPAFSGSTPYMRVGNLPVLLFCALLLLLSFVAARQQNK